MKYEEFLATVREYGDYADDKEAEQVITSVLEVFRTRIPQSAADHLAAQLPTPLDKIIHGRGQGRTENFGVEEFYRRIAERTGARPRTAEWDASAVLTALAGAISDGELNKLLGQLPSRYALLFGKPALSD